MLLHEKVHCYLDGVLIHEEAQPAPVKAEDWRNLYVGPFGDGWSVIDPWRGDTMIKSLRLYRTALNGKEIAEISGFKAEDIAKRHPEVLTIPHVSPAEIQADNERKERRWEKAASFVALTDIENPEKSWQIPENHFRVFCDDKNLYFGFDAVFPAGSVIKKGYGPEEGEKEVWGWESFELYFSRDGNLYRFAGSAAGGKTESRNNDRNYNPEWTWRSFLKTQINDSVLWKGEIVIPWKSIGLNAPPTEGISFNFCRSWLLDNRRILSALSRPGKGYGDVEGFKVLKPAEYTPVLQILSRNDPSYGTLEQKISMVCGTDSEVSYQITLENSMGLMTPEVIFNRGVQLKKDVPAVLEINSPAMTSIADRLVFSLTDKSGKKVYMRQILPVKIAPDYLTVVPLFSQEKILVGCRKHQVAAKYGKDFVGRIVLSGPDGKILAEQPGNSDTLEFHFPRNSGSGIYKMELRTEDAKTVISSVPFHFPGFGEWSRITFDNRILPPFTPLKTTDSSTGKNVSMWGRTYLLDGNRLFPRDMISRGESLFAAPVTFRINGKNVSDNVTSVWGKSAPHRFEYSGTMTSGDVRISSRNWIEYDGIAYYTVKIKALQDLKKIELAFTLPRRIGKYLHTAAVPWGTKITDAIRDGTRDFQYYPVVYLGNEEKGFCFFAESRHSWPEKSDRPMTVSANPETTELIVRLAPELKRGNSFEFEFGLLGTPVKKLPENYPLNTFAGGIENVALNRPGQTPAAWCAFTDWMPGQTHGDCLADLPPENNPLLAHYRNEIEKFHKLGAKAVPYNMAMRLSDEYPEVADFLQEWKTMPLDIYPIEKNGKKYGVHSLCAASSAIDFYSYNFRRLLSKAKLDGMYFDFGAPVPCTNRLHGCCDRTPILAFREFLRRIAICLIDSGAKDYIIVLHNTDCVPLPAYTFATHLFNGEQIRQASSSLLHDGKDILDSYPLAMFAVELNSMPFGLTNSAYLPADVLAKEFGGGKEDDELYSLRMTRAMLAGMLVHNSISSFNRCHHGIYDKISRIYSGFGVCQADFYGYYNPLVPVEVLSGKEVYVSCYRNGGKLLAIISHLGNKRIDQTVKIRFHPEKIGMGTFSSAVEKIDAPDPGYDELFALRKKYGIPGYRAPLKWQSGGAKVIDFKNNELIMELKSHTFALVVLE